MEVEFVIVVALATIPVVYDPFVVACVFEAEARRRSVLVNLAQLDVDDVVDGQQEVPGMRVVDQPVGELLDELGESELAEIPERAGKRKIGSSGGFRF